VTFSTNEVNPFWMPPDRAEDWKATDEQPILFWAACDRCNRSLPGPGSVSEGAAAARALGAGWTLRQGQALTTKFVRIDDVLFGAEMYCWSCSTEMDVDR